jgi:hypothetical protein
MGIRLALGASPGGVTSLVLRRVAWLVGLGVVAGTAASLWASRFVSGRTIWTPAARRLLSFEMSRKRG